MTKHSPRLFGFTLLELLVVISIIGILVAMGAASFSVAQRQGRNARRRGDLKSAQNCLEQLYVSVSPMSYATGAAACTNALSDPKGGTHPAYAYTVSPTATAYTYCVTPEIVSTGAAGTAICLSQLQ